MILIIEGSFHCCDQSARRSSCVRHFIDEGPTRIFTRNVAGAVSAGFSTPQGSFDVHQSDHIQADGQSRQRRLFRLLFLQFR